MVRSTILGCFIVCVLTTGALAGDLIIRGEADIPDGPQIEFSIPLQVLEAVKTSGVSAMVEDKEQLNDLVDGLLDDFASIEGKSLVELKMGRHGAIVKVEEAQNAQQANFVNVTIDPRGKDQPEISFSLPKGIFFLSAFIGNQFMETHGEELMGMLHQQIMMNCMPHQPPAPAVCPPVCPKKEECEKDDDDDDDDDECEEGERIKKEVKVEIEKEVNPEEIAKQIQKEINPQAIQKMILEAILKELK